MRAPAIAKIATGLGLAALFIVLTACEPEEEAPTPEPEVTVPVASPGVDACTLVTEEDLNAQFGPVWKSSSGSSGIQGFYASCEYDLRPAEEGAGPASGFEFVSVLARRPATGPEVQTQALERARSAGLATTTLPEPGDEAYWDTIYLSMLTSDIEVILSMGTGGDLLPEEDSRKEALIALGERVVARVGAGSATTPVGATQSP